MAVDMLIYNWSKKYQMEREVNFIEQYAKLVKRETT